MMAQASKKTANLMHHPSKTQTHFNPIRNNQTSSATRPTGRGGQRKGSSSGTRQKLNSQSGTRQPGGMNLTQQNFMTKNVGPTLNVKNRDSKLPPRAHQSPATNLKSKAIAKGKFTGTPASNVHDPNQTPVCKDNIYYPKTGDVEILYKKGARSISQKRDVASTNLNLTQANTSTGLTQQEMTQSQSMLMNSSQASIPHHAEERQRDKKDAKISHYHKCKACQRKDMDGHNHEVSESLERKIFKFNQNFDKTGHCKRHKQKNCELCSRGSSNSRRHESLSSNNSQNILTSAILKKHKAAPRSEIGMRAVAKSLNRPNKRLLQLSNKAGPKGKPAIPKFIGRNDDVQRVKSLPRDENLCNNVDLGLEMRQSTKNSEVRNIHGQLLSYGKKGNRPSLQNLPKQQQFAVSQVNVHVTGREHSRGESDDSRGYQYSEADRFVGGRFNKEQRNQNLTRLMSSKTTNFDRLQRAQTLQQSDPAELLDNNIKQLVQEWEGDPHDDQFWTKFEQGQAEAETGRMRTLRGMQVQNKQLDVIEAQSNVFKNLREKEEMQSQMNSEMLGGFVHDRRNNPRLQNQTRNSQMSLGNTMQDDMICTELDAGESMAQYRQLDAVSQAQRILLKETSHAVLTDYDITDEVGAFQQTGKTNLNKIIDFRDKHWVDPTKEDRNIEDLNRQIEEENRRIGRDLAEGRQNQKIVSEVDTSPHVKPTSAMNKKIPILDFSKQSPANKQDVDKFDEEEPMKPQLDSEDSGSYEKEKEECQQEDEMDIEMLEKPEEVKEESENSSSGGELSSRREKKTIGRITMYDDWLEQQTQKEIAKQSQANMVASPKSDHLGSDFKKEINKDGERYSKNQTQIVEPESKDDNDIMVSPTLKMNDTLPARPKTREITIPMNNAEKPGDYHGRKYRNTRMIPIPMDPNSTKNLPNKASKSPLITQNKTLMGEKSQVSQSSEQIFAGITSEAGGSKAALSYLTSPQRHDIDSKQDDLVLSTSIPELKSHLGASNKFKQGEIDVPTRFKLTEQDKNFTITEKVEEEQAEKTSSLQEVSPLKEVSPLTPDTVKSLDKSSPQKPMPQVQQKYVKAQTIQAVPQENTKALEAKITKSPAKPPTSPLKLKNKLKGSDTKFTIAPQQSLEPSWKSITNEPMKYANDEDELNQTFGSPRPGQVTLEKKLKHQPSDIVQIHSPPKQAEQKQFKNEEQLEPQILRKSIPSAAKPPIHNTSSQQPMHSREEDSLIDNQIDYDNLPKTNLNPTVQDFLQFEDSDDEDFGLIFKKHEVKAKQDLQQQSLEAKLEHNPKPEIEIKADTGVKAEPELKPESSQKRIELSPQTRKQSIKNKTPAIATASEVGLRNMIQDANTSQFMGPLESQTAVQSKTPNTGYAPTKAKAQGITTEKQSATQEGKITPPRMASEDEREVNDQINNIDYNVDQEGMSASYYRIHDQQRQLHTQVSARSSQNFKNQTSQGEITRTLGQNQSQFRNSESRQLSSSQPTEKTDQVDNTVNILETAARKNNPNNQTEKYITSEKKQSDEKQKQVRANMIQLMKQNLTTNPNQQTVQKPQERQNSKPRQLKKIESGENIATQSYQRPQGVKKMLTKNSRNSGMSLGKADSLNESQLSQPTEMADKLVNQKIRDSNQTAFRANATMEQPAIKGQAEPKKHIRYNSRCSNKERQVRVRADGSQEKRSSVDRLFSTETIASKMKRNPELYAYNAKEKKPPQAPPKRIRRKKSSTPPVEEQPKPEPEPPFIPVEADPQPISPRQLNLPLEPRLPPEIPAPSLPPLQMRLPEDPPLEPSAIIMPNLLQPLDPDVPDNDDVYPRMLEFFRPPSSPQSMRRPLEPEEPGLPERMIKSSTAEFYCEVLDEPETPEKPIEPEPEEDPYLPYPMPPNAFTMPPAEPNAQEEAPLTLALEPEPDNFEQNNLVDTEGALHFLLPKELLLAKNVGVGTNPSKVSSGSQYEEFKDALARNSNPFEVAEVEERKGGISAMSEVEFDLSDDDNFSMHSAEVPNKVTIGIQTSAIHFNKVEKTLEFQQKQREKIESTDWALSSLFDDISFAKQKKTIGGRKLLVQAPTEKQENCGNQVEEKQIIQETVEQILSQIECEYNADQLKRKMQGKDNMEDERLFELYSLGFSTLKALMLVLRLEKEWEQSIKQQYQGAIAELDMNASNKSIIIDPEDTIKLLTRCKKMYEAKTAIQRLLKMIVERDQMVEEAQISANIQDDNPSHGQQKAKESLDKINRLSKRITSQINTLQEEHRIFKRPFILKGVEYLEQMQVESALLEKAFANKFYIDESGTVKPSGSK